MNGIDPVVAELIAQLVRNGTLSQVDIRQISGALTRLGHDDLAHDVNVGFVEGLSSSIEQKAQTRRSGFQVFDGGNAEN